MGESRPLLKVSNLGTGYGDLRVVWDVSLEVWAGEVTVLLGRNGAGKTSTVRAIAGLSPVMAGSIELDGRVISSLAPHRRVKDGIAYVQEGKRVFHALTVEQNLLLGGYARSRSKRVLRRDLTEIYDLFPVLAERHGLRAGAMSGGQQQMLAIGQALMSRPRVLLLDEPSGGLAPAIVGEVMSHVERLKGLGIGLLLVEQAVEASVAVAEHAVVLDGGRTVVSSRTDEIDDISVLQDAYFGAPAPLAGQRNGEL